jgi:type IV pilus assembly protein PilM
MAITTGVWGIDIGQCALKAIRLESVNGVLTATAFDYIEHPKILSQPDSNPDELIREALDKFLERNQASIKGSHIVISVPGMSGLARFVKLPPVEEKKIPDIVKFEARQQIPFPLDEVVWDFQKVAEGTVTDGFAMDVEIGLFAMKRDTINRHLGHFQAVKLEVHTVQMAPLALCNAVIYDQLNRGGPDGDTTPPPTVGKKRCVVALDIGTDGSSLIITDGNRIIWQRPLQSGGGVFTKALTKELKLTFAKAEHLKKNAAKSPELPNILKALKPVLSEFVGEVQRSLGYFTNTHKDAMIDHMLLLGGGAKLPGLQKYLADKLTLDVRKPTAFNRLQGATVTSAPGFVENLLSFPVAYGLALQGHSVSRLYTNLLPPEITFERKVRAKKPYAVAAAASLLLGVTVLAFGSSVPYADANNPKLTETSKQVTEWKDKASRSNSAFAAKENEVKATQTQVSSIIAGQEERPNWIHLNRFVTLAIPRPFSKDGLPPFTKEGTPVNNGNVIPRFWNVGDGKGKEAINKYLQRLALGADPTKALDENDGREFLPMVNVVSFHNHYVSDLKALYQKIEQNRNEAIGNQPMQFPGAELAPDDWWPKEKVNTPPETLRSMPVEIYPTGEGWACEIRGYTYFNAGNRGTAATRDFLQETLVRNLTLGRIKVEGAPREIWPFGIVTPDDRVFGHIHHVFLYNVWEVKDEAPAVASKDGGRPSQFQYIDGSLIELFTSESGGPATGPSGGGFGGPTLSPGTPVGPPMIPMGGDSGSGTFGMGRTPGAGGWTPLLPANPGTRYGAVTQGGGLGMGMGGFPMGGGFPPIGPPMGPGPAPGPIGGGGTGMGTGTTDPKATAAKSRYEFVVVFVWKENAPSDALRAFKKAPPPPANNTGNPPAPSPGGTPSVPMTGGGGRRSGDDD